MRPVMPLQTIHRGLPPLASALRDVFGLRDIPGSAHFMARLAEIGTALPQTNMPELMLGLATLIVMIAWRSSKLPAPPYLAGAVFAGVAAWVLKTYWPETGITT